MNIIVPNCRIDNPKATEIQANSTFCNSLRLDTFSQTKIHKLNIGYMSSIFCNSLF